LSVAEGLLLDDVLLDEACDELDKVVLLLELKVLPEVLGNVDIPFLNRDYAVLHEEDSQWQMLRE
jgi:hypothetical protein